VTTIAAIGLGELLWTLLVIFVLVHILIATFIVIRDVLRSPDLSGAVKALWLGVMLLFPLITLIVYLVVRGDGIGTRSLERHRPPTGPPAGYIAVEAPAPT
jgi:hypothetical protein